MRAAWTRFATLCITVAIGMGQCISGVCGVGQHACVSHTLLQGMAGEDGIAKPRVNDVARAAASSISPMAMDSIHSAFDVEIVAVWLASSTALVESRSHMDGMPQRECQRRLLQSRQSVLVRVVVGRCATWLPSRPVLRPSVCHARSCTRAPLSRLAVTPCVGSDRYLRKHSVNLGAHTCLPEILDGMQCAKQAGVGATSVNEHHLWQRLCSCLRAGVSAAFG